jgi:hypothetical protein
MANWFDVYRGVKSGRIIPKTVEPSDGSYVFMLGADGLEELATVSADDYVELRQIVDLTGYDLVGANMKTVGVVANSYQPLAGFDWDEADILFGFDFNVGAWPVANKISGGFDLEKVGFVEIGNESYSPNAAYCRLIDGGASEAKMLGDNDPQAFPVILTEWTYQWWMNFDSSYYLASTGISPMIFSAFSPLVGGLAVELAGVAGLHKWELFVDQHSAGLLESQQLVGFEIDAPPGWQFCTLRYKHSLAPPNQLELFIGSSLVGQATAAFTVAPGQPASPCDVVYASKELVGSIDDMRLLSRWLTDLEIQDSYNGCISNPGEIDHEWHMSILIDDVEYADRVMGETEQREWTDLYVPVRLLNGQHEVTFRLSFKEV